MNRKSKVVVANDDFLKKFFEFVKDDKSVEDLANEFGLSHQGCYQKLRKIRKDLAAQSVVLPEMRVKNAKKTKISVEKLVEIAQKEITQ